MHDSLAFFKAGTQDASLIFGYAINNLSEQLYCIQDEKEQHRLLEKFLMMYLRKQKDDYNLSKIENAIGEIHLNNGNIAIQELCKHQFMSERNFRRKFIEYAACLPKNMQKLSG